MVRSGSLALAMGIACAVGVACHASTDPPPADAGDDLGPPLACRRSVDAYCAGFPCDDWASLVSKYPCTTGASCGPYDYVNIPDSGDRATDFEYYDHVTGKLVAIVIDSEQQGTYCDVGPPMFQQPPCTISYGRIGKCPP